MRTIGYGVIGLGFFGEKHAETAAGLPGVELRGICTRTDARRREVKRRLKVPHDYARYEDLLADPEIEAVSVVTHIDDHVKPTIAALEAGKHVLLEKPMARTPAECDRMLKAARRSGRILMVGHICRFNPRYALAHERIRKGELGKIVSLYARRNIPAARSQKVLESIDPLLGDGIHDTDLMLWMTGAKIVSAYAQTLSVRKLKNPDLGWAMYRFDSGAIGVIEDVWFLPEGTPFRIHEHMEVIGTEGSLYIHGGDMNLTVQTKAGVDCPDTLYWPELHGSVAGALHSELAYFVDCVRNEKEPEVVRPEEARAAVAVLDAAVRSARTNKPIKVRM